MDKIDAMKESKGESIRRRRRRKAKEKRKGPVICLFLERSICLIKPYQDDYRSEISEALTVPKGKLLMGSAFVNLGSKIYLFGGFHSKGVVVDVHAFDTEHPNLGFQSVASLHAPKEAPCVFVADAMIYALSSPVDTKKRFSLKGKGFDLDATGCFERYHPISDTWQVLPDPPILLGIESAVTIVCRRVFIAPCCVVFNLDSLEWDPILPPSLALRFPFGSLYDEAQNSLYYLRGEQAFELGEFDQPQRFNYGEPLKVAKRGPLPSPLPVNDQLTLLNAPCFDPPMEHIVAPPQDLLDPDIFFNTDSFQPWKHLFHMGGRFFCFVVTAQITDSDFHTIWEPHSRGVWIKFFEEVEVPSQGFQFRTLASFCYEINSKFDNHANWIRCCVLGSVPQSWIKDPPGNKVQESKLMRHKGSKVLQKEDPIENGNLLKLLAVREEEIRRLAAELKRKDEALKANEVLLAEIKGTA